MANYMSVVNENRTSPNIEDLNLKWIGDLSLQDAHLLHHYILTTNGNIIEFGVGGSTQIIAQTMKGSRKLISIDTSPEWMELTERVLKLLKCKNYFFVHWEQWSKRSGLSNLDVGLIFNDGYVELREQFGIDTWPLLMPGGLMIFHDTRHLSVIRNITRLIEVYHNEIEDVRLNEKWHGCSSNMTAIRKKNHEPYVNWNHIENKPQWRYGHPEYGPPPANYWDREQEAPSAKME
jgi:hypothetical protein